MKKLLGAVENFLRGEGELGYSHCFFDIGTKDVNDLRRMTAEVVMERVVPYYESLGIKASLGIRPLLLEPLKNSVFHGGGKVSWDLMMSPVSLVAGFFDGGEYFVREDVKRNWESRVFGNDKNRVSHREIGFGAGTGMVYDIADFIYVDNLERGLYVGLSVENDLFEDINS